MSRPLRILAAEFFIEPPKFLTAEKHNFIFICSVSVRILFFIYSFLLNKKMLLFFIKILEIFLCFYNIDEILFNLIY